ncbi:MAG: DUF4115 domain-containing protein [Actinomycetota bacterium]|nr:DUF4115 domain-containing protein [Actinomycetota bacterium]
MTDFVGDRELEIRRNATLNGLVGLVAAGLGIAFLWRASGTGAIWDFVFCAVLLLIGATQLVALVDARSPLLLADSLGVRIRLGREWRGLPWGALDQVVVESGDSALRDGRLVLSPRNLTSALADLDRTSRRQVRWLQRWYGAPLTVPLSISTRCSSADLVGDLRALVDGRTDVVQLAGKQRAQLEDPPADTLAVPDPSQSTEGEEAPAAPSGPKVPRRRVIGNLGTLVSRVGKGRAQDIDAAPPDAEPSRRPDPGPAFVPAATYQPVAPLRETRRALRAEVTRDVPATLGNAALLPDEGTRERSHRLPEGDALRRQPPEIAFDELSENIAPISRPGDPIAPVVVDDFVTEPALDPVIGPELAAARTRLGLSIDELSDRTRIRPHVLECIEVDDFAPCGGDFYARGHLRTLARVLGLDATPLLASYDERYAHAPINARRVFEAELATGLNGGMRATIGGPRWSLLVGAVLCLLMVWGIARFVTAQPATVPVPNPVIGSAAGLTANHKPITSPLTTTKTMTVSATAPSGRVVVRDRNGRIIWSGTLLAGQHRRLAGLAPFEVAAADGGSVKVMVMGQRLGSVGPPKKPATKRFG